MILLYYLLPIKNPKGERWDSLFFWPEEVYDAWYESIARDVGRGLGGLVAIIVAIFLARVIIQKQDDRKLILGLNIFWAIIGSYDLVLYVRAPLSVVFFGVATVFGCYIFCSKETQKAWDDKEREGVISSHKSVFEKQKADFQALSPEEQQEWYENYLKGAPHRLTIKDVILMNLLAFFLANSVKLGYWFLVS